LNDSFAFSKLYQIKFCMETFEFILGTRTSISVFPIYQRRRSVSEKPSLSEIMLFKRALENVEFVCDED